MKRVLVMVSLAGFVLLSSVITDHQAQEKGRTISPDLTAIVSGKGWTVSGRTVVQVVEEGRKAIKFDRGDGVGVAWLDASEFANGVIEFDVKGEDVFQKSFVGIAFHGLSGESYDAVYFRPFNFKTPDPERRVHAVQYISHPEWTWERLRAEKHNIYEKAVVPVPDPNGWFHARVVVAKPKVRVYVNEAKEPSLTVDELSDRRGGRIGLWMGTGSGGTFANLKIRAE